MNKKLKKIDNFNHITTLILKPEIINTGISEFEVKGNIAYLIEKYIETDDWQQIVFEIEEASGKNDYNELCWFIYKKLYFIYLKECENSIYISDYFKETHITALKTDFLFRERLYIKNCLTGFRLIDPGFYPRWYMNQI